MASKSVIEPLAEMRRFLGRPGRPPALLWVGAGASAAAGFPTLSVLAGALRQDLVAPPTDDYAVVDAYVTEYGRGDLAARLHHLFGAPKPFTSLHQAIARLAGAGAFPWILTTNYDRLLEEALAAAGVPFVLQILGDNQALGAIEQVQLLKVHGDLGSWIDVVLTSASYAAFQRDHHRVVAQLDLALRQRTVIFVGCSLTDPRLLDWLRGLSPAERAVLFASRAVLTHTAWERLETGVQELLLSAQIRPLVVESHEAVAALFDDLGAALSPL